MYKITAAKNEWEWLLDRADDEQVVLDSGGARHGGVAAHVQVSRHIGRGQGGGTGGQDSQGGVARHGDQLRRAGRDPQSGYVGMKALA